jgi:glutathione S-transferase
VIVLRAKAVKFDVTYINLREKPDWFLKISPHGKVPVLNVDGEALYESNAIAEFLDETVPPRLHPADPIKRARNRAWTDFLPDFAKGLSGVYYTKSKEEVAKGLEAAPARVQKLEDAIARERGNDGPYFNGKALCIVDAGYAPFFQRFAIADSMLKTGLLDAFPLVKAWSKALLSTEAVTGSVASEFNEAFVANLKRREFYVGTLFDAKAAAAD